MGPLRRRLLSKIKTSLSLEDIFICILFDLNVKEKVSNSHIDNNIHYGQKSIEFQKLSYENKHQLALCNKNNHEMQCFKSWFCTKFIYLKSHIYSILTLLGMSILAQNSEWSKLKSIPDSITKSCNSIFVETSETFKIFSNFFQACIPP